MKSLPRILLLLGLAGLMAHAADRPNILWITSEDNSPYLGCYGDPLAKTPNLDALAEQGVRYRHAFANAPVCSSARTTLITGMYASSLGVHNHRMRAVRGGEFRYVRNYSPHRPWGQHYSYPFQVQPSMRSWFAEFAAGRCNEAQAAYWKPKPGEEFYQIAGDPFELCNRIAEPQHAARVAKLRAALRAEILRTRDTGFIPEGMFAKLAGDKTIYEYAQSKAYPLERILDLADQASDRHAANLLAFVAALDDPHLNHEPASIVYCSSLCSRPCGVLGKRHRRAQS